MARKLSKRLSEQEFASLLAVGKTAVHGPPAVIPAEHSARLIELGYMMDLAGRLRMTGPGRWRIAAEFENRPTK
jgi:predicted nucleotide-binding protein